MKQRKLLTMLAIVGSLALVASSCSNDDDGGGGGDETGTTGSEVDCATVEFGCVEVASGEPISIGTLLSITGDTKNLGLDSQYGVELAADYLDGTFDGTNGQIAGHDIAFVNEDDGCSAEGGQTGATTLAADPQIVGVLGTSCSSASLGVADTILTEKGIVVISPSATNPALTTAGTHQRGYFRTAHNDRIQAAVVSDFVTEEKGAKTAVTIHDESPYTQGLTDGFKANFEANGGTVNAEEAINSLDKDFKPLLTQIAQNAPDVIYAPDFNPACALIAKQKATTSGLEDTILTGSDGCSDATYTEIAGTSADGVFLSGPDLTAFSGGAFYKDEFVPAYEEAYGSKPLSVFHAHAFDAMNILVKSIEEVAIENDDGSLTIPRDALIDAVENTENYEGVIGTLTCTPDGDCATSVTIGVYEVPDVGFLDPAAKPVFTETKTLDEVA
ncbi:MAG TPA: branched-chain amino acid ABC transporter substrate-binding protein [Actinomycetota bacterium]|nr:branched-chain amino acid ABC transporter substrate-binding protein [Actinomycetota bacterium]